MSRKLGVLCRRDVEITPWGDVLASKDGVRGSKMGVGESVPYDLAEWLSLRRLGWLYWRAHSI